MPSKLSFLLALLSLCALTMAFSCDQCLVYQGSVTIDCSLDTASAAVQQALSEIEDFCHYTCPEDPSDYQECMSNTISFLVDVYVDKSSEWDLEVVVLEPSQLCLVNSLCTVSCCGDDNRPEQLHISQGVDFDTMTISWVTLDPVANPIVYYWNASQPQQVFQQAASNTTYFAGGWSGTIYNATLRDLLPGTTYYYRVGIVAGTPDENLEHRFVTGIAPSHVPLTSRALATLEVPFVPGVTASVVAFFGDMGTTSNSHEVARSLITLTANQTVQMVVQGGDLSYANGDQHEWDVYGRMVSPFSRVVPVMAAPGNHEAYYHFTSYNHRYFLPWQESNSPTKQYYSFNYEKIHFVSWSYEAAQGADLLPGEAQREWLEADLAQANLDRDVRPWVVLFGHRPFYCSEDSEDCLLIAPQLRELMEDLINEYHIDVVLQAHTHNYERTYPVYNSIPDTDYVDPTAPSYILAGVGGRNKESDYVDQPDWSAHRDDKYGYLLLSAPSENSLELVYLSKSYKVHDSATIVRTQPITDWTFSH